MDRVNRFVPTVLATCWLALGVSSGAPAVTIDGVTVGAPGNASDSTGYGSVASAYRIGRYEVTVGKACSPRARCCTPSPAPQRRIPSDALALSS